MPSTTITSKGQVTIPKLVREELDLHPGDRLNFIIEEDGTLRVQPAKLTINDIAGCLADKAKRKISKPVSVDEMNQAIKKRFSKP